MSCLPKSILPFLLPFFTLFYVKKSFIKFLLLFIGSISCSTGTTICACLRVLGMKGEAAFANYHNLLNRSKIDLLKASKILIEMLLPLSPSGIILVVDEHLERRRGKKITAKAIYRDPVASSKKWKVKCFGLKWVVVSMLIQFSWSKRPFALPVFCVLRRPEDHQKNLKRKTRSGIDLACQVLIVIRRWFPHHKITLLGDGDYARVKLCQLCQKLSVILVTRLRADARLHELPGELKTKRGRLKKLGERIGRPEKNLWEKQKVNWYGGQVKEVLATAKTCIWLAGKGAQKILLKTVWVEMRKNDDIILMTTAIDMSISETICLFVKRWNLEVTFRECREYLGVETQRQWSDLAIERCTPLLFGLYTLVVLIGNRINEQKSIIAESTAWYKKSCLTFSDLLKAVREELGDIRNIANSLLKTEFVNSFEKEETIEDSSLASGF